VITVVLLSIGSVFIRAARFLSTPFFEVPTVFSHLSKPIFFFLLAFVCDDDFSFGFCLFFVSLKLPF
jgi:hypothetical protein